MCAGRIVGTNSKCDPLDRQPAIQASLTNGNAMTRLSFHAVNERWMTTGGALFVPCGQWKANREALGARRFRQVLFCREDDLIDGDAVLARCPCDCSPPGQQREAVNGARLDCLW